MENTPGECEGAVAMAGQQEASDRRKEDRVRRQFDGI